ncbi:anti-sigma factor family protein [Acidobacteriota bacterium]
MKCLRKREIMGFIDKELTPKRLKKIESHLETCSQCQVQVKKAQKEIQLVRQHLQMLNPEEIKEKPIVPSFAFDGARTNKYFWKSLINTTIRVPVPALIVLVIVFLLMAAGLCLQHQRISQLKIPILANKKTTLYIVDALNQNIEAQSLDIDLEAFQPITNPKVYKYKLSERRNPNENK